MTDFRTDYIPLPGTGLYVPPTFLTKNLEVLEMKRREMDKRFFAAEDKTGKYFTAYSSYGNVTIAGGMDKPRDTMSYRQLRDKYRSSAIDKMIILARKHQMRYVSRRALIPEKETGWRVVHVRQSDPNFENTPDIERRCREMEEIIERVNTRIIPGGFRSFLLMMTEDELIYDRKVMIKARDHDGLPASYWSVDPTSVKPRLEVLAPWMVKNAEKNAQVAAEKMSYEIYRGGIRDGNGKAIDLTTAAYVQEIESQVVGAWKVDEISVNVTNPVNEIDHYFYGRPIFEDSMDWTDAFMDAFNYNSGWFTSNLPEQLIFFGGDLNPEGYNNFQQQMLGNAMGGKRAHRAAFVTGSEKFKMQVSPLRLSMMEMAFPQWIRLLIAGKAACYRMDPRIINFDVATGNDGQNLWKSSNREAQLTLAEEQGFHTLIQNIEDWINFELVTPRYGDLRFRFVGLERPNEPDRIALLAQKASWTSLNETRNAEGTLRPFSLPGYPGLGDIPMNPFVIQAMQYMDQKRMMEAQQAEAEAGQQYGQSGGEGMEAGNPDEDNQASNPDAQPGPGEQPASPGDVARQSASAASRDSSQKSLHPANEYASVGNDEARTRFLAERTAHYQQLMKSKRLRSR